jgi:GNAT superfamily N-acetyltransferase
MTTAADVLVRPAAAADLERLLDLLEKYWRFEFASDSHFSRERLRSVLERLLAEPRWGRVWVAELKGALIGYIAATYVYSLEHGGMMAEVDECFVLPELRLRGVGAALLHAAQARLRQEGCVRVQLQVGRANARAREFYLRQGYTPRDGFDLWDKELR